ncbi:MAG: ribonuclease H family protein [Brumimicrobium sp.]
MTKKKHKYYVVWQGYEPGIYNSWEECQLQIKGYSDARYKSFKTLEEAKKAFNEHYDEHLRVNERTQKKELSEADKKAFGFPIPNSISVDGACSGNPGKAEYQGVYTETKTELFKVGPFEEGTNNIMEFLAIVHALAYCKQNQMPEIPIYSDSRIAMSWVRQKKCKTNLKQTAKNKRIFELIARGEKWLEQNTYKNPILKWETEVWGEIPADFGRK